MADGAEIRIARASADDLPDILRVQRGAFGRLAESLGIDPAIMPPLTETEDDLRRLMDEGAVFLTARSEDGPVVGAVRATLRPDGSVLIMRLAVAVGEQGRGIGSSLMRAVEDAFPDVGRFELYTGAEVSGLVALYERLGYRGFRIREAPKGAPSSARIIYMEKRRT